MSPCIAQIIIFDLITVIIFGEEDKIASQNIIKVIKSRRMRWVELVTRVEEMRNAYKMLIGKP
jgi:hypothetical protein